MSDAQQPHLNQSDIPFGDGTPGSPSAPPACSGRGPLAPRFVRDYRKTLLDCLACLLCFGLLPELSIVMFFLVPAYLAWASFSLLVIWIRPDCREWFSVRLILWTMTLTASGGLIVYNTVASETNGKEAAVAIEAYRTAYGRYPNTLQEAGIDEDVARRWFISYRYAVKEEPWLMYSSRTNMFYRCFYDFPTHQWGCHGD